MPKFLRITSSKYAKEVYFGGAYSSLIFWSGMYLPKGVI
jgi:hypothetical protein